MHGELRTAAHRCYGVVPLLAEAQQSSYWPVLITSVFDDEP